MMKTPENPSLKKGISFWINSKELGPFKVPFWLVIGKFKLTWERQNTKMEAIWLYAYLNTSYTLMSTENFSRFSVSQILSVSHCHLVIVSHCQSVSHCQPDIVSLSLSVSHCHLVSQSLSFSNCQSIIVNQLLSVSDYQSVIVNQSQSVRLIQA